MELKLIQLNQVNLNTHTMKKLFTLPALVLGLVLLLTGTAQKVAAQEMDVSLQTFYDELSPYGTWIQDSQYGYVWRPDVDQGDFRPYYTNGRWVMTEYGNTWVSDYNWGWAPFHYGRWIYNRYNEWLWIPDTTWGPAWVSWRSGGGYYGWAPLSPGINISINFGGGYHIPNSWWCFVPQSNIYYDRFPRYRSYNNVTIINNTTIINNVYRGGRNTYFTGPGRDDIRRATNRDVRIYDISRTSRSDRGGIRNNTVNIYNPRSSRTNEGRPAAPVNVRSESDYTASRGDRSSRPSNTNNDRGNGIFGNRGDRTNTGNNPDNRPGRNDAVNPGRDYNRPDNGRSSRGDSRPVATNPENTGRLSENGVINRPERTTRDYQPQRWQTRPVQPAQPQPQQPQQPAPQPQYQRPERSERPQAQPQYQRPQPQQPAPQPQYQRPERSERPQAQPQQRPERTQQSAPPRENRGSEQGGGDRGSRSGRG